MIDDLLEFSAIIRRTNEGARHFTIPVHVRDRADIESGDEIVVEIVSVEKAGGGDGGD